jgi:hypothetical protein
MLLLQARMGAHVPLKGLKPLAHLIEQSILLPKRSLHTGPLEVHEKPFLHFSQSFSFGTVPEGQTSRQIPLELKKPVKHSSQVPAVEHVSQFLGHGAHSGDLLKGWSKNVPFGQDSKQTPWYNLLVELQSVHSLLPGPRQSLQKG